MPLPGPAMHCAPLLNGGYRREECLCAGGAVNTGTASPMLERNLAALRHRSPTPRGSNSFRRGPAGDERTQENPAPDHSPALATALAVARPADDIRRCLTRTGDVSMEMSAGGGIFRALHSRYAPWKESATHSAAVPEECPLVVQFGLGGGFLPRQILADHPAATVVVVERDIPVLRTILEHIDFSEHLASRRLHLFSDAPSFSAWLQRHLPLVAAREIPIFDLPPWTDEPRHRETFRRYRETAHQAIAGAAGERAIMERFGLRWLVHTAENTLRSMNTATPPHMPQFTGGSAVVLGAGPDAERCSPAGETRYIAVDTVYPLMRHRGVQPLAVVSLDPQCWTTLHLRSVGASPPYLMIDPGAPPGAARDLPVENLWWLGTTHPLHQLLRAAGAPLVPMDHPIRSVGEAAVLVARAMGLNAVLQGMEGSAPRGKTYARGTWHYNLARRRAGRATPEEHFFAAQVYPLLEGETDSSRDTHPAGPVFTSAAMQTRRTVIEQLTSTPAPPGYRNPREGHGVSAADRFDAPQFWEHHIQQLDTLLDVLDTRQGGISVWREHLGPHGIAHIPAWHALNRRHRMRGNTSFLPPEGAIREVRTFLFGVLRRYS